MGLLTLYLRGLLVQWWVGSLSIIVIITLKAQFPSTTSSKEIEAPSVLLILSFFCFRPLIPPSVGNCLALGVLSFPCPLTASWVSLVIDCGHYLPDFHGVVSSILLSFALTDASFYWKALGIWVRLQFALVDDPLGFVPEFEVNRSLWCEPLMDGSRIR